MNLSFIDVERGFSQVHAGFKPDDMGVVVECGAMRWHPEWRLVSEMKYSYDEGLPEFWCTDGHRVYFNCPASKNLRVTVSDKPLDRQ